MNSRGTYWVIGQGGLLGRSMSRRLGVDNTFADGAVNWTGDGTAEQLRSACDRFLMTTEGEARWAVLWCAGAGVIGTDQSALDRETEMLSTVLENLSGGRGMVFLSSSAGGVYGGSRDPIIDESTEPCPISPYGWNKLAQETLVESWVRRTGNRALIARFTNLYGPGQNLKKPQGIVSQICLSTILRRPVSLYVSSDTLRDYIFVEDASRKALDALNLASAELAAGRHSTKIIGSGSSVSIGALLGESRRVLGRRASIILAPTSLATQQAPALAFKSIIWPAVDDSIITPLSVGIDRTANALRTDFIAGSTGEWNANPE